MKILTRILIILLAVAVVVGIVWAIGNSGLVSSSLDGGGEGFGPGGGNGGGNGNGNGKGNRNFASGELPDDFEEREHDGGGGGIQSWTGFLKTLLPIAIIIFVVRLIALAWDKIRRRNFPKAAVS